MSSINNVLPGGQPSSQNIAPAGQPGSSPQIDSGLYEGGATVEARTYSGGASTEYVDEPIDEPAARGLDVAAKAPVSGGGGVASESEPGLTGMPATIADFRALNLYTEDQLARIAEKFPNEKELGAQYDRTVAYYSSDAGQQELQAAKVTAQQEQGPDATNKTAASGDNAGVAPVATATIDDFKSLGVLNQEELATISKGSPQELGQMYGEIVDYYNSKPEGQQEIAAMGAASGSTGAFDEQWAMKLRGAFLAAGATPAMAEGNVGGIRQAGYDEAGLTELLGYLQSPEGKTEIAQAEAAAQAGATDPAGAATAAGGAPGWSDAWGDKFRALLEGSGVSHAATVAKIGELRMSGLSDADLQSIYGQVEQAAQQGGLAELNTVFEQQTEQLRNDTNSGNAKMLGGVAVGGAAAVAIAAANQKRQVMSLINTGTEAEAKAAKLALSKPSLTVTAQQIAEARAVTRATLLERAAALKVAGKPGASVAAKMAAKTLAPIERMTAGNALRWGVGMFPSTTGGGAATGAAQAAETAVKVGRHAATAGVDAAEAAAKAAAGAKSIGAAAGTASKFGSFAKVLGPIGILAGAGLGAWQVSETMKSEGGFGKESAKATGNVAGGLAGGIGGAAAGAVIGQILIPIPGLGALIGGVAGSVLGGWLGGMGGEAAGGAIHDAVDGADQVQDKK